MLALKTFDMTRGEGEWKNMQPIVRSSFKQMFEQFEKQQQQIHDLLEIAVNLKGQLALRPTQEDLQRMVEDKVRKLLPRSVTKDRHESLILSVSELRAELERKASMQYVDESLRRKIDKGDALVKQLSTSSTDLQAAIRGMIKEETQGLAAELGQVKSTQQTLLRTMTDLSREAGSSRELRSQVNYISSTLQDLNRTVSAMDFERLERSLQHKPDRAEVDSMMALKAEQSAMVLGLGAVERAIADQDRVLTSLRLRPVASGGGGDAVGGERWFATSGATAGATSGVSAQDEWDVLNAAKEGGWLGFDEGEVGRGAGGEVGEMSKRLRAGRDEIALSALWQRVQVLAREHSRSRSEARETLARVDALENTLGQCAGAAQVEALAVIAEEQRVSCFSCSPLSFPLSRSLDRALSCRTTRINRF